MRKRVWDSRGANLLILTDKSKEGEGVEEGGLEVEEQDW
jgi:hypothetical protein